MPDGVRSTVGAGTLSIGRAGLRLLHVTSSAQLTSGGPIEGIRQRARVLHQLGHVAEIASLDAPSEIDQDALGVTVHALGPSIGTYSYCRRLAKWLVSHRADYDAIIVSGLWQYQGVAVRRVARRFGIPYFVFAHGMLDPWFNKTYPLKHLKKLVYWPWEHAVLRDARAVLFTTEEERVQAQRSFRPYRVVERVVSYGTAEPPPASPRQEVAFFDLAPEARGKKILLYLGRIHPKKGLDLVIRAFAQVFGTSKEWVIVAAGPDQSGWKGEMQALAAKLGVADRVFWPGMLHDDAKWGAFRAAQAFILPSHQENFAIAVAESLGCSTPVLISDQVNIWREVLACGAGFVAQDNIDGAVELLQKLNGLTEEQRLEMGRRAAECFEANFESTRMATGLLNVINELGLP